MKVDLSIVIPLYNEEDNVDPLCSELQEVLGALAQTWELILVDDGSRDATWERLAAWVPRLPQLRLVRLRRNFGQTAAMSAGFDEAHGEIIITLDGDLQNDPRDIPALLEAMTDRIDVVSGWRKDRKDKFLTRRVPSMLANGLISRMTGVRLHDYGCTLKAYRREVLSQVRLYGEMHRFIPALAHWAGGQATEVVVNHRARRFGTSKYGLSRTTRVVLDLLTVKFLMQYSARPIQIFGRLGLYCLGLGGLLLAFMLGAHGVFLATGREFVAAELIKRPFWISSAFALLLFGMQFVIMGLLAELITRTYHESQNKKIYAVREALPRP